MPFSKPRDEEPILLASSSCLLEGLMDGRIPVVRKDGLCDDPVVIREDPAVPIFLPIREDPAVPRFLPVDIRWDPAGPVFGTSAGTRHDEVPDWENWPRALANHSILEKRDNRHHFRERGST